MLPDFQFLEICSATKILNIILKQTVCLFQNNFNSFEHDIHYYLNKEEFSSVQSSCLKTSSRQDLNGNKLDSIHSATKFE